MALYVNTNVTSLRGQSSLNKASNSLATTYNRLSTGLRINSAKDDAAGLQISDRLTSQINGLNQGNRNANDGIALTQTVEGAMDEMTTMLQRIRTLSVQAANGTNTTNDRASIQAEVTSLSSEITRIACKTTYGGKKVLSSFNDPTHSIVGKGNEAKVKFQVGANDNDTLELNLQLPGTGDKIGVNTTNYCLSSLMLAAKMTISDKTKADSEAFFKDNNVVVFNVSGSKAAQATLASIDKVINVIDGKRGDFGALQNRMESTISNQTNIANNETDARSRIRDTDYATEASNLSAQSIVQQAASSMLTQANSLPQLALSLLG